MIRTSPQTEQLDEAFAKAQAKFEGAIKGTEGQIATRRYKYADISSVIDATLEHLNAEGIGIRQHPSLEWRRLGEESETPFVTVTTRLSYKGQWEESDLSIPAHQRGNFDAQSIGSALSYACRYAQQGILVVRREDDDGLAATGRGTHEAAQAVAKEKIAALRESGQPLSGTPDAVPTLTYEWNNDNQTAKIDGPEILLKLHKPYLKQFWSPSARAIVVNGEQLENLKFEMEKRNTPFKMKELARGNGG